MNGPIAIKTTSLGRIDDDTFFHFCQENGELVIERDHEGTIYIMSPTGSKSGRFEAKLIIQLGIWAALSGNWEVFSSSTGFRLPDSSVFSPDASVIEKARYSELSSQEQDGFAPIAPDFVAEIRSTSDRLNHLQNKMERYILNGVRLAWLIDPVDEVAHVYAPGREIETLGFDQILSGGEVLPGFEFPLSLLK